MKTPPDDNLNEAYESFRQDHDVLRESLMASLAHRPAPAKPTDLTDRSRMVKMAIAAAIIIAALIGMNHFGGLPTGTTVAWGDVITHIGDVDYVHMYYFKSRGNNFYRHFEGWYAGGTTVQHVHNGDTVYDDGHTWQRFNTAGILVNRTASVFPDGRTFVEKFSIDHFSDRNPQFIEQVPTRVGDDFLIYTFDPKPSERQWLASISITVGRISLLPVQMKISHKDGDYDLLIFDYDASEKPAGFFEPPAITPANGQGEVQLDGDEVTIDITGAPDLKTALVRLHSKSVDDSGVMSLSLNITFITDDGFHSHTMDIEDFKPDEAKMCGTGGIGGFEGWPDGKYRNVRFSPWLKPTEDEDRYIVEIRCRILGKPD